MAIDQREFRQALGSFATGICVVGALDGKGIPFGMTINSFASVSLDPALILWSLQIDSDCFKAFDNVEKFSINVLGAEQQHISNRYAKKDEHQLLTDDFYMTDNGIPLLHNVLTTFECNLSHRYPGGDHDILMGEVINFTCQRDGRPLIYHGGRYTELKDAQ